MIYFTLNYLFRLLSLVSHRPPCLVGWISHHHPGVGAVVDVEQGWFRLDARKTVIGCTKPDRGAPAAD